MATAQQRIDELAATHPTGHHEVPLAGAGDRVVLVERNTVDADEHHLSLHRSVDAALDYHCQQDEPQWWQPLVVVDLADGTRHEVGHEDRRVAWIR